MSLNKVLHEDKYYVAVLVLILFAMLASACASPVQALENPTPTPATPQTGGGGLVTVEHGPAVDAAKAYLSEKLGVDQENIQFVSLEPVEWTDSCLGLGGPAESCLQVMTPGDKVLLQVGEVQYELHTNEDGSVVRMQ